MRYQNLIAEIDRINSQDPNQEEVSRKTVARELVYSKRMLARLLSIEPDASELLKIAVYGQHINRWKIPRQSYPEGRKGYLAWRRALAEHHAQLTSKLMIECGYSEQEAAQVRQVIKKENLKSDFSAQTLEDVACLVFLEYYLAPMQKKHCPEKIVGVIRKTWHKMSHSGREHALQLRYTEDQNELIQKALAQ